MHRVHQFISMAALLVLTGAGPVATAGEAPAKLGAAEAAVKAALQKRLPQMTVDSVARTPLPGIYEVFTDGQIVYVDESARHLFNGNLFNLEKSANLTQDSLSRLTAIKFDQLPLNLAIKRVKGKGTRKLAYFADPNCGYCKKLEQDMAKIDNVTLYIFLYPVLGPDSVQKAKAVWCSKDRVKAWDDLLQRGIAPTAAATCDTPVERIVAFGTEKKITGTPTMFFADGQRIPGAMPQEQIEQRLASAK